MASTRNHNTLGNYVLQKRQNVQTSNYVTTNEYNSQPVNLAGYGFIQGHLPQGVLSSNAVDIESFLFGINSTNLTNDKPLTFVPQLNTLNTESVVVENRQVILPAPLEPSRNQRPF